MIEIGKTTNRAPFVVIGAMLQTAISFAAHAGIDVYVMSGEYPASVWIVNVWNGKRKTMLTTSVIATTTHAVLLKPTIKKKLLLALRTYVELGAQKKVIELARSKQATIVEDIQVELGESSLDIDGFKSTIVAPIRHTLDKKLYVALGGDLGLLERAMVPTPGKSYLKITAPGNGDSEDD